MSTPPTTEKEQYKQEEEKKETQYNKKYVIQTLVELPKIGTPTKPLQQLSTDMLTLQVRTPGSSSTKVARTIHYGIPSLMKKFKYPIMTQAL